MNFRIPNNNSLIQRNKKYHDRDIFAHKFKTK